jgi:hypothetical protein
MNTDRFSYNADRHRLELGGLALFEGEVIAICVFGHWIPGSLALDSSGWYLITPDQIGIRLREGLAARRPHGALLAHSASNGYAIQQ